MTGPAPLVLIIEDEAPIRRFLRAILEAQPFRVVESATGEDGLRQAATRVPDVVLLDLGLPDVDGLEVTRRLREWTALPIVVLSARGQEKDKVAALDAGADDYLTKPFGVDELLARVRVALRHRAALAADQPASIYRAGSLEVDLAARQVRRNGEEVHLTPTEYKLLAVLVQHSGRVVTHRQLLHAVWGPGSGNQAHHLRVQMHGLRRKLEDEPAQPQFLATELGVGYRLRGAD